MSGQMKTDEDCLISGCISWIPKSEGHHISDVIQTYQGCDLQQVDTAVQNQLAPLHVEQVDDLPCVITLQCVPQPRSVITSLLVVSEARTIEVYSASGDYCGTCRGEQDSSVSHDGVSDSRPFYRKHLKLECPTTSCEVKLLSLGGRAGVGIAGVHVGVQVLEAKAEEEAGVRAGGNIDLMQVQSMMEEMGTTLSPGAQHLMDMVQFQQKSKADAMAGFLPLLMGSGALSGLTKGSSVSLPHAAGGPPPSPSLSAAHEHSLPPRLAMAAPDKGLLSAMMAMTMTPGDDGHRPCPAPAPSPRTATPPPTPMPFPSGGSSQGKLVEVMSALMRAPPGQHCAASSPDLLPFLQSVCCQVAKLRMDDTATATAAAVAHSKVHMPNGPPEVHPCCRGLEEALEKRLQEMEARLKEHLDQRLDSLEQKLDTVLHQVLQTSTQPS